MTRHDALVLPGSSGWSRRPRALPSASIALLALAVVAGGGSLQASEERPDLAATTTIVGEASTPVLEPNGRLLVPDSDVRAEGVSRSGDGAGPLYEAVADGATPGQADDRSFVSVDPGVRRAAHRVGLSSAPSGNVISAVVRVRAAAGDMPTTATISLFDRGRRIASGSPHRLVVSERWEDLSDRFADLSVSSAENLHVEVEFDSGIDGVGSGRYSSLSVEAGLRVSLRFGPTALRGGGPMTAVAIGPVPSQTVMAGSPTSGLFRSADGGLSFTARNAVMTSPHRLRIAGVAFHPTRPGVAYAVAGAGGEDSAMLRSTDDGETWMVVSGTPGFSATGGEGDLADEPSSVGDLLAFWDAPSGSTTIWAATYDQGLLRSEDGGVSWEVLGLDGLHLRGLAQHPTDPDTLYLASWGAGLWVTGQARAAEVGFSRLSGGPENAEEVAFAGDTLFVAGGAEGLYRLVGTTLVPVNDGVPLGVANWNGLAGYASAGGTIVFASCDPCQAEPDGTIASILRSVDDGTTWHSVTGAGDVDLTVAGTTEPWLLAGVVPGLLPGTLGFGTLQLAARAPGAGEMGGGTVLAAARGGIWRSADGGDTWAPAVDGLGGLDARGLAGDPGDSRRVFHGVVGLGSQSSGDEFDHVTFELLGPSEPAGIEAPVAFATAFDPVTRPSTVFVALGDLRRAAGGIHVRSGSGPGSWLDTGFSDDIPRMRPTAVAVGRDLMGERVLLATAHPGGGVVRKVGDGPWAPAEAAGAYTDRETIRRADLQWVRGTQVVFLFDPAKGIFRSTDAGLTWAPIWLHPSNRPGTSALATGADPDVLFVASNRGVHRLDGAASGTVEDGGIRLTQLGTFRQASDVVLDGHGRLWVVSGIQAGAPARLAVSWDPLADEPTFHDLATRDYVNTVIRPDSMHVTVDGDVIVADTSFGIYRGRPSDTEVEPWLPPDIVLHSLEQHEGPDVPIEPENVTVAPALLDPFIVHVAPDGDDRHDGLTEDAAVVTLARAQEILQRRFGADARDLTSDVLIRVRPGRYVGQAANWTFTHPRHIVRIAGHSERAGAPKPHFVGCGEPSCTSARAWFVLNAGPGQATNVQLVNLRVSKYLRAVTFQGGGDIDTQWNGFNLVHRCEFDNIGTRFRSDITPEVWSPAIIALRNSRSNRIWQNRFTDSSNRMDHANPWFHTIYASQGASDNSIRFNRIVNTSGDFHIRNRSDRNVFADNWIHESFYWALVTDWSSELETESCETEISGNVWLGDWYCELNEKDFHRETASPDGRCARSGLLDYVVRARNAHLPAGSSCVPS